MIGTVIRAPESKPIMVRVVVIDELDPNNVLIVVALKLICVPITVLDTFVPIVVVELEFDDVAASVLIPTPLKLDNNLISNIQFQLNF